MIVIFNKSGDHISMTVSDFALKVGKIWFDGEIIDSKDAQVHILTHAMHYGSSVFEGERAYNGKIFKVEAHNDRLFRSAHIMDMDMPFDKETLLKARQEVLEANNLTNCYMRPLAWRGDESMGIYARNNKTHVMIAAWEWPSYFSPEKIASGLTLKTSKWRRPAPNTAPIQAKASGGYMIGTLAKHEAHDAGFDDALMLDYKNRVAESSGANIFMIKDNKAYTPPLECSLNGITRLTMIDILQNMGISVSEKFWDYDELITADEIMLTGTAAEIQAVGLIDTHKIPVGDTFKKARQIYSNMVYEH